MNILLWVLQFLVVLRFFPETKGYTLEELQEQLETKWRDVDS
jgi:hypothetical protein